MNVTPSTGLLAKTPAATRAAPAWLAKGMCLAFAWMVSSCSWESTGVDSQSVNSQRVAMAAATVAPGR
jgi:hypothetical protein